MVGVLQLARSEYGDKAVRKKYREWGDLDAKFDDWFRDNWTRLFAVERGVKLVREQRIALCCLFRWMNRLSTFWEP